MSALDGDGNAISKWPVFRCLFGEIEYDQITYVLDGGKFYAVARDYLEELDRFVDQLPSPTMVFPPATPDMVEDNYNRLVARGNNNRLLLDRKTVRPASRTTDIEICDVLTIDGDLIHVKRKLGSSDLSKLFAQGYVSAETIHAGPEFRATIRAKIDKESRAQRRFPGKFSALLAEPFAPQGLTVVFAVLADWKGRSVSGRMPFFGKTDLRHFATQLGRMGFGVEFAKLDTG